MADTQKAINYTAEELDSAIGKANSALQKSGGTMTGALALAADPVSDMQAATKKYVDTKVTENGGGGGSYELPTASATVKGGVMVGDGLMMSGDVLGVDPTIHLNLVASAEATSEVTYFKINTANDGSTLAIKNLYLELYVPVAASAFMTFCYMNGYACFAAHNSTSTTEECRVVAFANTLSGYQWLTWGTAHPISTFGAERTFVKYGKWLLSVPAEVISEVTLEANASGAVFPIGTTVKLYEVIGNV